MALPIVVRFVLCQLWLHVVGGCVVATRELTQVSTETDGYVESVRSRLCRAASGKGPHHEDGVILSPYFTVKSDDNRFKALSSLLFFFRAPEAGQQRF